MKKSILLYAFISIFLGYWHTGATYSSSSLSHSQFVQTSFINAVIILLAFCLSDRAFTFVYGKLPSFDENKDSLLKALLVKNPIFRRPFILFNISISALPVVFFFIIAGFFSKSVREKSALVEIIIFGSSFLFFIIVGLIVTFIHRLSNRLAKNYKPF